jgi:glycosyltransferase involved in cell wall biosynthesis
MRILKLHNLQRLTGGVDRHIAWQEAGLRARGHECETWFLPNRETEGVSRLRAAPRAIWNPHAVRLLHEAVESFRPDLVHVHTPFPLMSPAVFVEAHRMGLPVVGSSHSYHYNCPNGIMLRDQKPCEDCVGRIVKYPAVVHRCCRGNLLRSVVPTASLAIHRTAGTFRNCVDMFLTNTAFGRERMIAEGVAPDKVTVVTPSRPDPGLPLEDREDFLFFAGRFVAEKGVGTLLQAWAQTSTDMRLVIAGDGPLLGDVESAAAADSRINYVGFLEEDEMVDYMRRAEALLFPSEWYEGLGIIIVEAFAAGTPVIASDVGNFTEFIVPGYNGSHFRSGDSRSLTSAIEDFVATVDRRALRTGARETYVETLHPDDQIDLLIRTLERTRRAHETACR